MTNGATIPANGGINADPTPLLLQANNIFSNKTKTIIIRKIAP